jgi:hypothetical protein
MFGMRSGAQQMQAVLKAFTAENPEIKPISSQNPLEIAEFIISNAPPEARSRWLKDVLEPSLSTERRSSFQTGTIALILSALAITAVFVYGVFFQKDFLGLIADPAKARGLITFLFAFGTIAIILIISISVFWTKIDEVEQRVGLAKDVLTILIGIFGTILGFYFGSLQSTVTQPAPQEQQQPANP